MRENLAHEFDHLEKFRRQEERLQFEELLSEISSVYTNLSAEDVDKTITYGLQRIGKFLGADRCNLCQFSEGRTVAVRILHSWADTGQERLPNSLVGTSSLFPWVLSRLKSGKVVQFSRVEDLPEEGKVDRANFKVFSVKSHVSVPVVVGGENVGFLTLDAVRGHREWPEALVSRLRLVGEVFANALVRKKKEIEIERAFSEIKKLKDQLETDNIYLREELELANNSNQMLGQSDALKRMLAKVHRIAHSDTTVLVLGETGTGKELVARAIHEASGRRDRSMVKLNCAALPGNLIESELFGHEKGAFTSAHSRQFGRFELAHGGTLFLDEIGELPLESQAKLLRVLQEGEFERLGSSRTIKVDVRIVAATNRNLEEEVRQGRFRQDLWYRLNVFPIVLPPLRDRKEDIPVLVHSFAANFSRKQGKTIRRIPYKVIKALQEYDWPGNIRELENVIERSVINTQGHSLQLLEKLECSKPADISAGIPTLEEVERNHIFHVLEATRWKVEGPHGAAFILGLNPSTLRFRMRKLGLERPNS